MTIYCANDPCEAPAIGFIKETRTPLCWTCQEAYQWGQASPENTFVHGEMPLYIITLEELIEKIGPPVRLETFPQPNEIMNKAQLLTVVANDDPECDCGPEDPCEHLQVGLPGWHLVNRLDYLYFDVPIPDDIVEVTEVYFSEDWNERTTLEQT